MEHDNRPMPLGTVIRPNLVGRPLEERLMWSDRWKRRARKKTLEETAPELSAELATVIAQIFRRK